jgi:hypothetical protein
MKKKVILTPVPIDKYRVEKTINTLEPKVGQVLTKKQIEELMAFYSTEVEIKKGK